MSELDAELSFASAASLLRRFKARKLSPVEAARALIARIERLNFRINALGDRYFDEALAAAKKAERRYLKGNPRALEGVPLLVKDAQRLGGKRTTHGSLIFEKNVDDHSDPQIARLIEAGAIVLARTTTPEFCLSGVTHSRMWGVTRNPWNTDFGPGGSSGGSGAALAAGFAPLATGTDIGGSIRIPASACGVAGFKPPHGRNPDGPPANFDVFNHCGPMARAVADLALMQNVTSGPHALDHDSLRERIRLPLKAQSLKGVRIAWSADLGYFEVEPEVRANLLRTLSVFRGLGARVTEVELGWTEETDHAAQHWYNTMNFGRQTVWFRKRHGKLMTDYALKYAKAAEANTTVDDVHKALAQAHAMYQTLGPILAGHDALICPTNNLAAVKAEHDPWDQNFRINGKRVDAEAGWVMTLPFNMLRNLPVLAVPSGHRKDHVPTGIQIVGRSFDDATVFRLGLAYEREMGGWFTDEASRPSLT
jgi:Asp-tRNA(Asn)/Glu-tRNA(Gln) amidotransferase A subunit family amidase